MSSISLLFDNRWSFEDISEDSAVSAEVETNVRVEVGEEQANDAAVAEVTEELDTESGEVEEATEVAMRLFNYGQQIYKNGLSRSAYDAMNYDGLMDKMIASYSRPRISRESINTMPTMDATAELCLESIGDTMKKWGARIWEFIKRCWERVKRLRVYLHTSYKKKQKVCGEIITELSNLDDASPAKAKLADIEFKGLDASDIRQFVTQVSAKITKILQSDSPLKEYEECFRLGTANILKIKSMSFNETRWDTPSKLKLSIEDYKIKSIDIRSLDTEIKNIENTIKDLEKAAKENKDDAGASEKVVAAQKKLREALNIYGRFSADNQKIFNVLVHAANIMKKAYKGDKTEADSEKK